MNLAEFLKEHSNSKLGLSGLLNAQNELILQIERMMNDSTYEPIREMLIPAYLENIKSYYALAGIKTFIEDMKTNEYVSDDSNEDKDENNNKDDNF